MESRRIFKRVQEQANGLPLHLVVQDKVLCATQRAGSTSMIEAIDSFRYVSPYVASQSDLHKVMWIRNPAHRLASAWSLHRASDVDQWVEKYVLVHNNAHWLPQTTLHSVDNVLIPDKIYCFDDLATTWDKEFPLNPLGCYRSRPTGKRSWDDLKKEVSEENIEKLNKYYAQDWKLYNETKG